MQFQGVQEYGFIRRYPPDKVNITGLDGVTYIDGNVGAITIQKKIVGLKLLLSLGQTLLRRKMMNYNATLYYPTIEFANKEWLWNACLLWDKGISDCALKDIFQMTEMKLERL